MPAKETQIDGAFWTTPASNGDPSGRVLLLHGAGAPADSEWMTTVADTIATNGLNVYRAEFSYMSQRRVDGKRRPPPKAERLLDEVHQLVKNLPASELPLILAGKSMGGRLATLYAASRLWPEHETGPDQVWVFGYPFHPPGKPEKLRTSHLTEVSCPIRILQGSRDAMGNSATVSSLALGSQISLQWIESGNHDLRPLGLSKADVMPQLQSDVAAAVSDWWPAA